MVTGLVSTVSSILGGLGGNTGVLKARDVDTLRIGLRKRTEALAIDIRSEQEGIAGATTLEAREVTSLSDPISQGPALSPEELNSLENLTDLSQDRIEAMPEAALARLEAQAAHRGY